MASSKLVCRGNGKFCRKPIHAVGMWLLLASIGGLLLLCFTYIDVTSFYTKSNSKELHAALQRGTNLGSSPNSALNSYRPESERPAEATLLHPTQGTTPSPESQPDDPTPDPLRDPTPDPFRDPIRESLRDSFDEAAKEESATVFDPTAGATRNDAAAHDEAGLNNDDTTVGRPAKDEVKAGVQSEVLVMPGGNETTKDGAGGARRKREKKLAGGRCDIAHGRWVYDESYPLYRSRNCPFVDPGFRCEENGRPDTDFMQHRWQPFDCDLPRFNPQDMLERLRNQRLVFVGDSLGRNQWESMLCMLAEGVQNKSRIYEMNGEPISKHVGSLVFRFQDYNCTVEYYRDPFLVPQTRPPPNSPDNVTNVLVIDEVSWSVSKWWPGANILVLNSGHWWSSEKIFRGGGRFQMKNKLTTHDFEEAFQIALKTWTLWMEKNLDPKTIQVFFRSYASVHFRGGAWNTGGRCDEEVKPLTDKEVQEMQATPWTNKHIVNAIDGNLKSTRSAVEFMDVTTSTDFRADGHAGLYSKDVKVHGPLPKSQQDCSHFCLPGVPDTWNEFLYATLLARGQGAWGEPVRY